MVAGALGGCATQYMPEILPVSSPPTPAPVAVLAPAVAAPDMREAELLTLREEVLTLRAEIAELRQLLKEMPRVAATPANVQPEPALKKAVSAKSAALAKTPVVKAPQSGPKSILPDEASDFIIKPTAGGPFAVHLGSYRSEAMAVEGWRTLTKAYPTLLPAFTPQADSHVMGGQDGKHYRLVAGPLGSREDARKLCRKLAETAAFCTPADFTGSPLIVK